MNTRKAKGTTSEGRRGVVAILSSGLTLLVLAFSIGLAGTKHETTGRPQPAVSDASVQTAVEPVSAGGQRPAPIWTGRSEEDITQRRLPGHSECDLQLD